MNSKMTAGVALALALAACGADDDGSDDKTTTLAPAPASTTPAAPGANPAPAPGPTSAPAPVAQPAVPAPLTSTQGRLLVADGDPENPRMLVVDLDDAKVVADFPTLGTALTYRSHASSAFAFANQRVPGIVEIVHSGIELDESAKSVKKSAPAIVPQRFEAELPTHWVSHDTWVVSFNDGDGSFDYLLEPTLGQNRVLMRRATTGRKHHGVAVIAKGNVFATLPDPNDMTAALPVGVSIRRIATPNTVVRQSDQCPLLHGEGGNDDTLAFGCGDGVLLAERKNGDFEFRKLPNPDGTPAGRRVGTVRMESGLPRVVGNWGNGVVIIDHSLATPTWTPVDFGSANLSFQTTPDGKHVIALDGTGSLRKFDAKTGAAVGSALALVDAWVSPQLRPALGLGDGKAFVADPRKGTVVEADLASWTKQRTITVGGKPSSVAAFGRTKVQ
jgi:hypothetical protein